MTPLSEFLDKFCSFLEENLNVKISAEELPDKGGLYAELDPGTVNTIYYSGTSIKTIPVTIMCKSANQKECLEELNRICDFCQKRNKYPDANTFKWLDSTVSSSPNKVGRLENRAYIYACVIDNKIFY